MGIHINNIYSIIYIIFIYILATNWQLCRQHIFIYHYYKEYFLLYALLPCYKSPVNFFNLNI